MVKLSPGLWVPVIVKGRLLSMTARGSRKWTGAKSVEGDDTVICMDRVGQLRKKGIAEELSERDDGGEMVLPG